MVMTDEASGADGRRRVVCGWCGSEAVSRDAWASWDVAAQAWVLGAVFDDGFCHACACARGLEEVEAGHERAEMVAP